MQAAAAIAMMGLSMQQQSRARKSQKRAQNEAMDRQLRAQAEEEAKQKRVTDQQAKDRAGRLRALRGRSGQRSMLSGGQETGGFRTTLG